MKFSLNRISIIIISMLFVFNLAHGQIIIIKDKATDIDSLNEIKISKIIDSLHGIWELIKTVKYTKDDTLIQIPSSQLWLNKDAKPFSTIKIDSFNNFEINQFCLKCPYLYWTGKYEIETNKDLNGIYLNFIDKRINSNNNRKRKNVFNVPFCGFITYLKNDKLIITDLDNTKYVFMRQSEIK